MLKPFAWEEMLDMITRLPGDLREIKDELATAWMRGVRWAMEDQEVGIKKILDSDMTVDDVETLFQNTGYVACRKCSKIVGETHKHIWERTG